MAALLLLLIYCLPSIVAEIDLVFRSRPDLYPPVLTITHRIPDKLTPGYIFLGPYEAANSGPYIYDNEGNLVWSGWGSSGPGNAHGMHVCKYKGEDHLCFFQGIQQNGYCRGHGVIMDNRYRTVKTVVPGGGMASSDMHEFLLTDDGKTALLTVYQQRQFDMSLWNVKTGLGWLMQSIFQEVDVETNEVRFEWNSLDHVDPTASYTYPGHTDTSGTGLDPHSPWDYFHINSIDKNKDGDYLISSRHTCAIYKISGQNGTVIWQLHGARPSFKNLNFSFSQQHDARWLSENGTHTVLSLYNNGYNGFNRTHGYSSGMVILIDHVVKTATQLHGYAPLKGDMLSSSQGNMQVLPSRNVFIGWGNHPYISEHDQYGNLLLWGYLAKERIMNYRAQKFRWEGNPTDVPALWTYSRSTQPFSPLTMYVSWNGATRVRYWRFYGSRNITGPYALLHQAPKTGFETTSTSSHYYPWTYAEAVDLEGKVLGKSRRKFTFTPSAELQPYCANNTCENAPAYGFPGDEAAGPLVPPLGLHTVPWVDPLHPNAHFDWGESAKESRGNSSGWFGPLLVVGLATLGVSVALRQYWHQRHQVQPIKEPPASEAVDDGDPQGQGQQQQPQSGWGGSLAWWHWRRWTKASDVPPSYFPLTEPAVLDLQKSSCLRSISTAHNAPVLPALSRTPTQPSHTGTSNKSRNARHTRTVSWTSGHEQGGEPSPLEYPSQQRRRRESSISLADVSERSSTDDKMALRHTSFEQPGHARNRSQSQMHGSSMQPPPFSGDPPPRPGPVTWMTLPRKKQLALLGLCRVFDFLQIASLQAYMFYQLKSFDENLSDADVSTQAGILQGAFTAAQFATAIPWGRVADAEWGGRKFVLLVGLLGTAVSCLGVAFATSFAQAVFWRSFGGAINGTVGIIRTMIAENVREKKYHSRAFLILPIGFNIASLFGPVMGGMLSDPVRSYPALFGPDSSFGGANGVQWLERYPYALPMLANAIFLSFVAFCVGIGLEETLEACKGKPGLGVFTARIVSRVVRAVVPSSSPLYQRLPFTDGDEDGPLLSHNRDPTESYELEEKATKPLRHKRMLPFRRLWTKNVLSTLLAQAFFDFQMGAFNNLWLLFLSSPRYDSSDPAAPAQRLPFIFTGGLGMLPQSVGFATAILGVIGMLLQFTVYPAINSRLGTAKSYQYFLTLFPLAYAFAPYIALAPSSTLPPGQANGPWVWFSIIVVLFLQVTARTFTLPTSIILLNNCSPHPSVLGTIHGVGQSVSSAFRTIGPIFSGSWYGYGLEMGMVGFAWWLIALVSIFGCLAAIFVYEGSGHEILLPGEEEDFRH
ncbi:MFS general substrate transporter [Aspergillus coremiiformis]|uniref:MFS general substrate transporter n=1 Tax=Aspergillus coremiiformis TaxID=138285 RepID=A0A5N6ZC16_9EURO|nr:MFS general substrate transporter [Aspergillus coremiiformis]